ncbi:MAG: folate-binding protein YgfZ, partial [Candidatus Velamenicoccus archaeovorus]
ALEEGRAFVVRTDVRLLRASGTDARRWLHDLITTDVEGLAPGSARRSLVLTPTGRIRADVHVCAEDDGGFVLAQQTDQVQPIADVLAPYVLSSDVRLEPDPRVPIAVPGPAGAAPALGPGWSPSALGEGVDLLVAEGAVGAARDALRTAGRVEVSPGDVERWRILRGRPRFPVDLEGDALPAEGGLDGPEVIDTTKGCFLGQESVAKVRTLGHPPRVILAVAADAPVGVGEPVVAAGRRVGTVTSTAAQGRGSAALVRVRWEARDAPLATGSGTPLRPRSRAG